MNEALCPDPKVRVLFWAAVYLEFKLAQLSYASLPMRNPDLKPETSTSLVNRVGQPDSLGSVCYVPPFSLAVTFADARTANIDVHSLGLDPADLDLGTVRANDTGTAIEVLAHDGESVFVDASVVRAEIDPEYAAHLEQAIAHLSLPKAELEKFVEEHQPPQSWFDEEDLPF
jgi:hypothetical protein